VDIDEVYWGPLAFCDAQLGQWSQIQNVNTLAYKTCIFMLGL
jgi:hypothetical protein